MVALDLLGRKWALRILWQLKDGEKKSSRVIQAECEITSPNVLTNRLRELREANIVALEVGGGYRVTREGMALLKALEPLAAWADQWAKDFGREDLTCFTQSQKLSNKG